MVQRFEMYEGYEAPTGDVYACCKTCHSMRHLGQGRCACGTPWSGRNMYWGREMDAYPEQPPKHHTPLYDRLVYAYFQATSVMIIGSRWIVVDHDVRFDGHMVHDFTLVEEGSGFEWRISLHVRPGNLEQRYRREVEEREIERRNKSRSRHLAQVRKGGNGRLRRMPHR